MIADMIVCQDVFGNPIRVLPEEVVFSPRAYGIAVEDGKVLLLRNRHTLKWEPPGGGVEPHELLTTGLGREVWEETGLEIAVERLLLFEERFFRWDPSADPWHVLAFYYQIRITGGRLRTSIIPDEWSQDPQWVPLAELTADNIQVGMHAIRLAAEGNLPPSQRV